MSIIWIRHPDDEHVEVLVDGEPVAYADHDSDGWAGMEAVRATAMGIARELKIKVIEE